MKFKADQTYLMPVAFGEAPGQAVACYDDSWTIATVYLTDRDALAALLPPGFEPGDEPLVTVAYTKCAKVDFLSGGGYNLFVVNLAATFRGQVDHMQGNFGAVLWENNTIPITLGRELLGAPKLYADIPDPFRVGNDWRVHASENGRILVEMTLKDVQPVSAEGLAAIQAGTATPWMGWRCIPNVNGRGMALSEPTYIASEAHSEAAWVSADAQVTLGTVTRETNPMTAHILAGLRTLVVREYRGAVVTHGSSKLLISQNRVLR